MNHMIRRSVISLSTRTARSKGTLAILESKKGEDGALSSSSKATLAAAENYLPKPVLAVVTGEGQEAKDLAESVAKCKAVDKVLVAQVPTLAEPTSTLLASLVKKTGVTHVVTGSNTYGKNITPRMAALIDVAPVTDVVEVVDEKTFVRPIYAGNAMSTVKYVGDGPCVLTVRSTAFAKDNLTIAEEEAGGKVGDIDDDVKAAAQEGGDMSAWVGEEKTKSERPQLDAATVVVSGGRALKSAENFVMLEKLADQLNGALGASRAAVDAGMVQNDLQVGQTGKVVAPDLYIAVGISGAIQHLAGMKDSRTIVAINKDPEAPIFKVADYGLVGDLFKILPELSSKLETLGYAAQEK